MRTAWRQRRMGVPAMKEGRGEVVVGVEMERWRGCVDKGGDDDDGGCGDGGKVAMVARVSSEGCVGGGSGWRERASGTTLEVPRRCTTLKSKSARSSSQ